MDDKVASTSGTVSIFAGKNASFPDGTSTIGDLNSDDVLRNYMRLYTHFKVTGCQVKLIFNHTGNFDIRPIAVSTCYSDNTIIHPNLDFEKLNAMDTARHYGTDQVLTKFYGTEAALKKLGIEWCGTEEWLTDKFRGVAQKTYGDQLPIDRGASMHFRVNRPNLKDDASLPRAHTCRLVITWFMKFRGRKGATDIN